MPKKKVKASYFFFNSNKAFFIFHYFSEVKNCFKNNFFITFLKQF